MHNKAPIHYAFKVLFFRGEGLQFVSTPIEILLRFQFDTLNKFPGIHDHSLNVLIIVCDFNIIISEP